MWSIILISAVIVGGSVCVSGDKTKSKTDKREGEFGISPDLDET